MFSTSYSNEIVIGDTLIAHCAAKNELVLNIIEDDLGEQTRRIAQFLMNTYRCTLSHIIKHFHLHVHSSKKLSPAEVRKNLILLLQHRCLTVERPPQSDLIAEGPSSLSNHHDNTLVYSIDTDMVINRMRAGRAIHRARQLAGTLNIPVYAPNPEPITNAPNAAINKKKTSSMNDHVFNGTSNANASSRGTHSDRTRIQQFADVADLIMERLHLHGRATLEQVLGDVVGHFEEKYKAALHIKDKAVFRGGIAPLPNEADSEKQMQRAAEWRFVAYYIFHALIQARLICRIKKLTPQHQQHLVKLKTMRGPKVRPGITAVDDVKDGRAVTSSGRVGSRKAQVMEEDEEDNQLPDEMRLSVRHVLLGVDASTSEPLRRKTVVAHSTVGDAVDRYAVLEARPDDGSAAGSTGFGPFSQEQLADGPVSNEPNVKVEESTGKRDRSDSRKFVVDSDSEEEERTRIEPKAVSKTASEKKNKGPARKRAKEDDSLPVAPEKAVEVNIVENPSDVDALARKDVLWGVNWEQLYEHERIDMCVRYTRDRLKEKAARVLRIIMEESLREEGAGAATEDLCYLQRYSAKPSTPLMQSAYVKCKTGPASNAALDDVTYNELPCISIKDSEQERMAKGHFTPKKLLEYSRPVDLMRVINAYTRLYVGTSHTNALSHHDGTTSTETSTQGLVSSESVEKPLDMSTLRALLEVLVSDTSLSACRGYSAYPDSGAQGEYIANAGSMISVLQRKTITSIARARYGVPSARLIELMLTRDEWVEQSVLGDLAILPAREAREKLYLLFRDKWVDFKEISKRSDYNPQSTFYFWRVDYQNLRAIVLEHSYKGMLNLRLKRASVVQEFGDKDVEVQALALYAESAGTKAKGIANTSAAETTSGSTSTSVSNSVALNSQSGHIASGSTDGSSLGVHGAVGSLDGDVASPAALAIQRGSIVRADEKRSQNSLELHRGSGALGMDVAIGRLDLAMYNLELTIMLLDRFEHAT